MSYKKEWYDKKRQAKIDSANALVPIILDVVKPNSVIDVGCGDGTWLSILSQNGINDYLGIDGEWIDKNLLQIPKENFKVADLTKPLKINRRFDLAITLEVAEHLPADSAKTFVNSLTDISNIILFSAAVPFQGGTKHYNEQWQSYWAKLFKEKNFQPVNIVGRKIWNNRNILPFYKQNIVLYVEESHIDVLGIDSENIIKNFYLLDKVHPEIFEEKMQSFKESKRMKNLIKRIILKVYKKIFPQN